MSIFKIISIFLLTILLFGCQFKASTVSNADIHKYIQNLSSTNENVRNEAYRKIGEWKDKKLTEKQGKTLLEAAAGPMIEKFAFDNDPAVILITAAAAHTYPSYIQTITNFFLKYNPASLEAALSLLAGMDTKAGLSAYMELILLNDQKLTYLPAGNLSENPVFPEILFPRIWKLTDNSSIRADIYDLTLHYLENGSLNLTNYPAIESQILNNVGSALRRARELQKPTGRDWIREKGYTDIRYETGLLLDLTGYTGKTKSDRILKNALTLHDPELKLYAVLALLRQNESVSKKAVLEVAADPEIRNHLYDSLAEMDRVDFFPKQYENQEAFAESEMVSWLCYPAELGRTPDEIELMNVIPVDTKTDGLADFYVYRFRSNQKEWKKKGWMAGVAGPFLRKDAPTTTSYGYTFSSFEPWDSRTPTEHLGDIKDIVADWGKKK